jgi:hypothetical protein
LKGTLRIKEVGQREGKDEVEVGGVGLAAEIKS